MSDDGKKTECIKLHVSEKTYLALCRNAARDDRKLSDFIGRICERWLYGNDSQPDLEGLDRGE